MYSAQNSAGLVVYEEAKIGVSYYPARACTAGVIIMIVGVGTQQG